MGMIWFKLFVVVFPISACLSLIPVAIYWFLAGRRTEAKNIIVYGAVGGVLGYLLWFVYYTIAGVDDGVSLLNFSLIGALCVSGYAMIVALAVNEMKKRNKKSN